MLATSLKKITDGNLKRNKLRALCCILAAVFAIATTIVEPFLSNAYFYYSDLVGYYGYGDHGSFDNAVNSGQLRANECRDAVYADLCMLGTIYLSNCEKGEYKGTADLYENLYATLSYFGDSDEPGGIENIFGLDNFSSRGVNINQSHYNITNIDSDYFYFYVAYGDQYLTNIDGVERMPENNIVPSLVQATDNSYYYLRQNNTISSVTPHKESGLGKTEVYYSTADGAGGKELTSEYLDSDKLLLGAAGKDNYDRYTFCFSNVGDMCINSWNYDDNDYENIPNYVQLKNDEDTAATYWDSYYDDEEYYFGERRIDISKSDPDYKKYVSMLEGVYDTDGIWTAIENIPDYTFQAIDTSELTVFMSPKVDIVKAATTFTSRYKHKINLYHGLEIAFMTGWAVSAIAFAVISLVRPSKKYKSDTVTFGSRLFKLDFSIVALLASVFYIIAKINSYSFYGYIINISISNLALQSLGMLLAHILGFLSIDGIIRHFKINGKSKPRLLIKSIIIKTAPVREKISERYARIPIVKAYRSAKLKTRYSIKAFFFSVCIILLLSAVFIFSIGYGSQIVFAVFIAEAVIFILYMRYVRKIIKDISKLEIQIDNMLTDGEVLSKSKSELKKKSLIYPLSEKLATISDKAEQAVEKQVQSEKMKVELVTNVSHDLKTPLTSIISYIDLLEKTELSDEAMDYVKILRRKSDKLRDIVADVFTLAKAVSGVEVESEELDFAILTRQVLADNSDKIEISGRDLRTDISVNAAPIIGDGAKLYRVIQNLLDNALKYSMEGTRIFLALSENNGEYELTVKNVSAYEMNFTAEEITERFTRGDKSRTDGGSGLGLSIAKSFTQVCGGRFDIIIDGDVFKAAVTFHKRETSDKTTNTDIEPIITADEDSE